MNVRNHPDRRSRIMRRSHVLAVGLAAAIVAASHVDAQTNAAVQSSPGKVAAAQTKTIEATITAIDPATREVTLKSPKGHEVTVVAGPQVQNFAQMKVGDKVHAEYLEALTVELKKGGGQPVARVERGGAQGTQPGAKPAAMAGHQVTVVADVVAVDPATQSITLKGPEHTVDVKVADPEQFKLIAKGDQVEATYTEAVAIAVKPMK
jgi:Cu/Ag efflux protein CusF